MKILAIDPGSKESAFVCIDSSDEKILTHNFVSNIDMLTICLTRNDVDILVIESIEGFGMTAGQEIFDTCWWSGRFCQGFASRVFGCSRDFPFQRLGRKAIKSHLCGCTTAKDKDIREALIHRYGEPGTKTAPGRLYGISGHVWSALAVAVTYMDTQVNNTKV